MDVIDRAESEQAKLWNGPAGRAWVETQDMLDRILMPFEVQLMEAVPAGEAAHVLDVGCGAVSTTLSVARRLGDSGQATGVDISEPLITAARARANETGDQVEFICDDAQRYPFAAGSFDLIISRFGVMFFDDSVAAFRNLRRATRPGGELWFVAWRGPEENPFMVAAERAAAPHLPELPPRNPDAPGQFGFANRDRVFQILEKSGWIDIDIGKLDLECALPECELNRYLGSLGPLGLLLQSADEGTRKRMVELVRPAFNSYLAGGEVRFNAACWMVGARAPA